MNTPITFANRQTLTAQVATLDFQINKLAKLFNSTFFKGGSLMVSGRNSLGKEYHELIVWDKDYRIPKNHLMVFLQLCCEDLIRQRSFLIETITAGKTEFVDQTRMANCNHCSRQTMQRNYYLLPGSESIAIPAAKDTWICNECESSIIKL